MLVDRFLADATEVDVDAICDGERVVIGGIMEHIEQAGVHSGDSACSLPPYSLREAGDRRRSPTPTRRLALELGVRGLMNVQYAVKDGPRLRARGEPARVAHGAVRLEGDRAAAREAGGARDGGRDAATSSASPRRSGRATSR